ncbi:MAG: hypothetical protein ACRDYC_11520, partial [Acidimicrobiales bacterium]
MNATGGRTVYLRVGLGVALVALVAIALGLGLSQGSSNADATNTVTTPPVATTPTTSPPPPTIPGAATGPVTEPQLTGACALALVAKGPPAAPGQCTAIMVGDSLGEDVGFGLEHNIAASSGLTLYQLARSDSGLAVPAFFNWPVELQTYLTQYKPQLVVICLGGNDQQGMVANGRSVQFGTPAWNTEYINRIRTLVSEATTTGAYVMWVGLPVMQQTTYDSGSQ